VSRESLAVVIGKATKNLKKELQILSG